MSSGSIYQVALVSDFAKLHPRIQRRFGFASADNTAAIGRGVMERIWHGRPYTLYFCDELQRLYGHEDGQIAEGASFAVENWAAAGFWQELEDGLMTIKQGRHPQLRLAFFTWHNRVEAQHAGHTMEELEEVYFGEDFNKAKFFEGGRQILDGVAAFWDGLEKDRVEKVYTA